MLPITFLILGDGFYAKAKGMIWKIFLGLNPRSLFFLQAMTFGRGD